VSGFSSIAGNVSAGPGDLVIQVNNQIVAVYKKGTFSDFQADANGISFLSQQDLTKPPVLQQILRNPNGTFQKAALDLTDGQQGDGGNGDREPRTLADVAAAAGVSPSALVLANPDLLDDGSIPADLSGFLLNAPDRADQLAAAMVAPFDLNNAESVNSAVAQFQVLKANFAPEALEAIPLSVDFMNSNITQVNSSSSPAAIDVANSKYAVVMGKDGSAALIASPVSDGSGNITIR
jgi:hypothetical protein